MRLAASYSRGCTPPKRNLPRGASIDPRQNYRKTRLLKSKQHPPAHGCLAAVLAYSFLFELICFEGTSSLESPLGGNESPALLLGLSSRLFGLSSRLSAAFAVSLQRILGMQFIGFLQKTDHLTRPAQRPVVDSRPDRRHRPICCTFRIFAGLDQYCIDPLKSWALLQGTQANILKLCRRPDLALQCLCCHCSSVIG